MVSREFIFKVLKEIKTKLKEEYKEQFDKLILFGSVARNEMTEESDVDMLVMMNKGKDLDWREKDKISSIIFGFMLENDLVIDVKYFDKSAMKTIWARTPFMETVFKEGVKV